MNRKFLLLAAWTLNIGKARGMVNLKTELFKHLSKEIYNLIKAIIEKAWKTKEVLDDWKPLVIVPIQKNCEPKVCTNSRKISLNWWTG